MPLNEYVESLYDESETRGSFGVCRYCEDDYYSNDDDEEDAFLIEDRVLCYICGVCFKYHHDENSCEPIGDEPEVP